MDKREQKSIVMRARQLGKDVERLRQVIEKHKSGDYDWSRAVAKCERLAAEASDECFSLAQYAYARGMTGRAGR